MLTFVSGTLTFEDGSSLTPWLTGGVVAMDAAAGC